MCRIKQLFGAMAMALVVACANTEPPPFTEAERSAIRDEVATQLEGYWDRWRAADFEGGVAYYDDHPDFVTAHNATTYRPLATALAAFRTVFDSIGRQEITIDEVHIAVPARDLAYVTERGTFVVVDRNGTAAPRQAFAATHLWVRVDGQWKVRSFHESTQPLASP
jgi:hypothetical protein